VVSVHYNGHGAIHAQGKILAEGVTVYGVLLEDRCDVRATLEFSDL